MKDAAQPLTMVEYVMASGEEPLPVRVLFFSQACMVLALHVVKCAEGQVAYREMKRGELIELLRRISRWQRNNLTCRTATIDAI